MPTRAGGTKATNIAADKTVRRYCSIKTVPGFHFYFAASFEGPKARILPTLPKEETRLLWCECASAVLAVGQYRRVRHQIARKLAREHLLLSVSVQRSSRPQLLQLIFAQLLPQHSRDEQRAKNCSALVMAWVSGRTSLRHALLLATQHSPLPV